MFSFFSRKPQQPPPEAVPLPPSPSASATHQSPGSKVRSASPTTKIARLSIEERQTSPTRRGSLSGNAGVLTATAPNPAFVPPEPTVESLAAHIGAIPAKTLHAYVLARIPRAEPPALPVLASFFAELAPPLRLHCVRCHKDYAEVENDDRSCLVPHDDDSAEVERVGAARRANRAPGTVGTTFETLWGCCAKIVEGDGDQGPPDGWCYEGKHTTDIKRARFRADSTPHDDKLVSCLRLNCHGIRAQMPRGARSMRKRPRSVNLKEASTDDDEDESAGGSDSGMDEIAGRSASAAGRSRPKGKGKAKGKAKAEAEAGAEDDGDKMDVDESASVAGSVRSRGRPPPKSKSKTQQQAPGSAAKRRVRVAEAKVVPGTDGEDDEALSVKSAPTAGARRRGRVPKSKPVVVDPDCEMAVEGAQQGAQGMDKEKGKEKDGEGGKEKPKPKPRPRSLSRTRPAEMSDASVGVGAKPRSRAKKVREANARDQEAEDADADDEKPKKRRKVVDA